MKKKKRPDRMITAMIVVLVLIFCACGVLIGLNAGIQKKAASQAAASASEPAENRVAQEKAEEKPENGSSEKKNASAKQDEETMILKAAASSPSLDAQSLKGVANAATPSVIQFIQSEKEQDGAQVTPVPESTSSSGASGISPTPPAAAANGTAETGAQETPAAAKGKIVCIDPGHQDHGMSETEPNGPGSSTMKAKLTSGTSGVSTGKSEYEVNLEVSLKLRDELRKRGYQVVMTRESNQVSLSNVDRAQIADKSHADIFIRVHCNSLNSSATHGALAYEPTAGNPYLSSDVISGSQRLAQTLLNSQIAATGQRNAGIISGDDMTGINWATMPVTIIEIGFMSNPDEDQYICSDSGQARIVEGLANGVDTYFGN